MYKHTHKKKFPCICVRTCTEHERCPRLASWGDLVLYEFSSYIYTRYVYGLSEKKSRKKKKKKRCFNKIFYIVIGDASGYIPNSLLVRDGLCVCVCMCVCVCVCVWNEHIILHNISTSICTYMYVYMCTCMSELHVVYPTILAISVHSIPVCVCRWAHLC